MTRVWNQSICYQNLTHGQAIPPGSTQGKIAPSSFSLAVGMMATMMRMRAFTYSQLLVRLMMRKMMNNQVGLISDYEILYTNMISWLFQTLFMYLRPWRMLGKMVTDVYTIWKADRLC
jgi:hypothetical protein